jgi:hypothetical protein
MLAQAIPPLKFTEQARRHSTCRCGKPIMESGFGWVHEKNAWIRLGDCYDARPRPTARDRAS